MDSVPYHSNPKEDQWLTQGYYFWTDSDFFAHAWGKRSDKYPNGYFITKFELEIPCAELFDLVGNVRQQLFFDQCIKAYLKVLGIQGSDPKDTPVSKVIDHLRLQVEKTGKKEIFPYCAVKAADRANVTSHYPYLAGGSEVMQVPTRQQLCLFADAKSCIKSQEKHALVRRR